MAGGVTAGGDDRGPVAALVADFAWYWREAQERYNHGQHRESVTLFRAAGRAAQLSGDRLGECRARQRVADVFTTDRRIRAAILEYGRAARLAAAGSYQAVRLEASIAQVQLCARQFADARERLQRVEATLAGAPSFDPEERRQLGLLIDNVRTMDDYVSGRYAQAATGVETTARAAASADGAPESIAILLFNAGLWMALDSERRDDWRQVLARAEALLEEARALIGKEARVSCADPVVGEFYLGLVLTKLIAARRLGRTAEAEERMRAAVELLARVTTKDGDRELAWYLRLDKAYLLMRAGEWLREPQVLEAGRELMSAVRRVEPDGFEEFRLWNLTPRFRWDAPIAPLVEPPDPVAAPPAPAGPEVPSR